MVTKYRRVSYSIREKTLNRQLITLPDGNTDVGRQLRIGSTLYGFDKTVPDHRRAMHLSKIKSIIFLNMLNTIIYSIISQDTETVQAFQIDATYNYDYNNYVCKVKIKAYLLWKCELFSVLHAIKSWPMNAERRVM